LTADAIVVLGAALRAPGVAGPALRRRVAHAVRLLADGAAGHMVLSGGVVGPPPAEAVVMRDLAMEMGAPAERLVMEDQARNTFENAVYTGRIMRERGWRRVLVVTDPFHVPRALYVFRRLGLEAAGAPVRDRGDGSRWVWYAAWGREALAFVKSWYLFRIGAHRPLLETAWGLSGQSTTGK